MRSSLNSSGQFLKDEIRIISARDKRCAMKTSSRKDVTENPKGNGRREMEASALTRRDQRGGEINLII